VSLMLPRAEGRGEPIEVRREAGRPATIRCGRCGHGFHEALGRDGCPNCHGEGLGDGNA
jgi:Zn finger protein HypA/HybF involved in hydrogenase expression